MRTTIGIDVGAPPRIIFDLARKVSDWPALLPHYRQVTISSLSAGHVLAEMHAVRPLLGGRGIRVAWRSEQWADDSDPTDLQLRFRHLGGFTRGMDVTWHIRPSHAGSRVTIEHDFERRVPLLGRNLVPRLVDTLFVRPIASRTLARLKELAEAPATPVND
jgi:ribosome-associated toxin RatA of RatAB toxin-antitoxin module